ncbi:FAD:protein FMN transferase [bacterium]|nr:FAD:protein FMN transferase [bacterium]
MSAERLRTYEGLPKSQRLVAIVVVLGVYLSGCGRVRSVNESSLLMGTVAEITVQHKDPTVARKVIQHAFDEGKRIENLLSIYKKESEISMVNLKAGLEEVKVSEDSLYVIEKALYYSELSDGVFDITVGPLIELWGFRNGEKKVPDKTEIEKILALVNYKNLSINREKSTVKLEKPGMQIDLGGIAKGYAVDSMIGVLKRGGIKEAIVNAGGDIYALGNPAGKSRWHIGIRNPRNHSGIEDVIELKNSAIVTSGDYEKFFFEGGKRYSHIIDPRTGVPASAIRSVTVTAPTATEADALATALFVLGEEEGKKLIKQLENVEAFFN